ncbi:MAG: hypothetical protein IJ581_03625 [Paludibacteraceae bacterium]|nr:hypothetical protein [Paludibacteraceae bacterium]
MQNGYNVYEIAYKVTTNIAYTQEQGVFFLRRRTIYGIGAKKMYRAMRIAGRERIFGGRSVLPLSEGAASAYDGANLIYLPCTFCTICTFNHFEPP